MDEWDEQDQKLFSINAKAINTLYCGLNADEFNRLSSFINAKEI